MSAANVRRRGVSIPEAGVGELGHDRHGGLSYWPRASSTIARTMHPVPPPSIHGRGFSANDGPAMSMWVQGMPPTNR